MELVAGQRLFPHSPMTGDNTKLLAKWETWAIAEFGDVHRAKAAADATVVSSSVGLPDALFMQAARAGARIGCARSAALCSSNLDEMFENLVAFGWRPVGTPADTAGEPESLARVPATASVLETVMTEDRRSRWGTGGSLRYPLEVMWRLVDLPRAIVRDQRMRRHGYGWLEEDDGWLVITATEATFVGKRHTLRVPIGDVTEIRDTSDLALTGVVPGARVRVARPSLILALLRWLQSSNS